MRAPIPYHTASCGKNIISGPPPCALMATAFEHANIPRGIAQIPAHVRIRLAA